MDNHLGMLVVLSIYSAMDSGNIRQASLNSPGYISSDKINEKTIGKMSKNLEFVGHLPNSYAKLL